MNYTLSLSELIRGMGSIALGILIFSLLLIFFLFRDKEMGSTESLYHLKSLFTGFAFLGALIFIRRLFPTHYHLNPQLYELLSVSFIIQTFTPIQIYFFQKVKSLLNNHKDVFAINLIIFVLNVALFILMPRVSSKIVIGVRHFLQLSMIILALYLTASVARVIKYNYSKKRFKASMPYLFIYIVLLSTVIVMFGTMFNSLDPYKAEAFKLIMFISNIIVFTLVFRTTILSKERVSLVNFPNTFTFLEEEERDRFEELKIRLLDYFESSKPYLDSKLCISQVSLELYSNKTYLSRLINEKFNSNFNQFVNSYRVKEAQRVFIENPKLSLQQLCYASGFGSMATFNMAFRIFTHKTPADWCREHKIKSANNKSI